MTTNGDASTPRVPTQIDELCDSYIDVSCASDPFEATYHGVPGYDHLATDFSPAGVDDRAMKLKAFTQAVAELEPVDSIDTVTKAAVAERGDVWLSLHALGVDYASLNVIASPVQAMRDIFDLMPKETEEQWRTIAKRLRAYPEAIDGYRQSLRHGRSLGVVPSARQVTAVAGQLDSMLHPETGSLAHMVRTMRVGSERPSEALHDDVLSAAGTAGSALSALKETLLSEVLPQASHDDAVGVERYQLYSRAFLGSTVDLRETYEWGLDQMQLLRAEMLQLAQEFAPGATTIAEAKAVLDQDQSRNIPDAQAFRDWMQATADEAVTRLNGVHFDIPAEILRIDCKLAPSSSGGIYYTGPSEDFTRPGTMWWSVPPDQKTFGTWQERTTVYHEGVPGHHLQVGQTMVRAGQLNRWRRLGCWVSGHGEGWALYAERLMADLGFLDDPADRFGMLSANMFRAMRVVGDIGLHCRFTMPPELGTGIWDADALYRFMEEHSGLPSGQLAFEHLRYLGWPGQAPSYKIGERLWLQLRDEVRQAQGDQFDVRVFHRKALDLGSVGLDVLRTALLDTMNVR